MSMQVLRCSEFKEGRWRGLSKAARTWWCQKLFYAWGTAYRTQTELKYSYGWSWEQDPEIDKSWFSCWKCIMGWMHSH